MSIKSAVKEVGFKALAFRWRVRGMYEASSALDKEKMGGLMGNKVLDLASRVDWNLCRRIHLRHHCP